MENFLKSGKVSTASSSKEKVPLSEKQEAKIALAPWVEKYRPKSINDVIEQSEVVAVLRQTLSGSDLPNLLLYGPPGTGKTSTILAAARELFGDIYKDRILELNASDERGISIVRTKIKNFAQLTASATRPDGKPCPPFKIIILDEADSMTNAAQAALRRTIEKESYTTRFCLVCNYVSRIIEPITSRCTKFRFKSISDSVVIDRLGYICTAENISVDEKALQNIVGVSGGDMRRAITMLQSCYRLKGGNNIQITDDDITEISAAIPMSVLLDFLNICKNGNFKKLEDFVIYMAMEAYSAVQFFEQLNGFIITNNDLSNKQKSVICDQLGTSFFRLQEGGSEYLQIIDLGCVTIQTLKV